MPSALRPALRLPPAALWLLASLACYWGLLIYQLGAQWSAYEQYNYGWAVPFLCAYLLWRRLQKADDGGRSAEEGQRTDVSSRRTSGFRFSTFSFQILFYLLAILWFVTRWLHEANPIWRLTSWVLALVVVGLTLLILPLLFAPDASRLTPHASPPISSFSFQLSAFLSGFRLRNLAFPVGFFLVAVPWPSGLEAGLVDSLTRLNVAATIELLNGFGIPALVHGNLIEVSTGMVGVDDACSGIRSFQATLMISLFLGELYRLSVLRRLGLCLAGFSLAFVFNVGRTTLLTWIASRDGVDAIARWHDPAGITILVACFLGLWLVSLALRKQNPSPLRGEGVRRTDEVLAGSQTSALRPLSSAATPPGSQITDQSPPISTFCASFLALPLLPFILLGWFIFTEIAVEVWYRTHEAQARTAQAWTVRWPTSKPTFQRIELSDSVKNLLLFDEGGQCAWSEPDGSWWQMFYFRWQPSRSLYTRVRSQLNKTHRPEHCLTGSGMKQVGDLGVGQYRCGEVQFALKRLLFQSDGRLLRVFYAQYENSANPELLASYRENTSQRIAAAWAGSRNYGLRILEIAVAGNLDAAQADAALQRQLEEIIHVPLNP